MITVLQLAEFRLGRSALTGQDFIDAALSLLGGCQGCGASLAAYNAYPARTGFWRCSECLGEAGFGSVEEANAAIFDAHPMFSCVVCDDQGCEHCPAV